MHVSATERERECVCVCVCVCLTVCLCVRREKVIRGAKPGGGQAGGSWRRCVLRCRCSALWKGENDVGRGAGQKITPLTCRGRTTRRNPLLRYTAGC